MSQSSLHILLVNNYTVRCGICGAVAALANAMAQRGHKVSIISQRPVPRVLWRLHKIGQKIHDLSLPHGSSPAFPQGWESLEQTYPLHENIEIIPYRLSDKNLKIQKLRKKIRALNPDVCVCPLPDGSHLVWAVTLLGTGIPYVYSEHHNPQTIENEFWTRKGRLAAMSGADAIHLLLPSYLESLPDFLRQKAVAIPNSVEIPQTCADPVGEGKQRKKLLWLGRLHDELKQCRLALDAFALVAAKFPEWDLIVAGDGQDRKMIRAHAKKIITRQHLAGRIKFIGEKADVWPVYADAQAFCFSSRTEGLPLVLLEAMSSGLPVAAFKSCPGVEDLIEHEKTGLLAEEINSNAMAAQLERLLEDDGLRVSLGQNARQSLAEFSEKNVYDAWERLLQATASTQKTEMDKFSEEPFASLARLSSCARREWLWRDFGKPVPYSLEGYVYYWIKKPLEKMVDKIRGVNK